MQLWLFLLCVLGCGACTSSHDLDANREPGMPKLEAHLNSDGLRRYVDLPTGVRMVRWIIVPTGTAYGAPGPTDYALWAYVEGIEKPVLEKAQSAAVELRVDVAEALLPTSLRPQEMAGEGAFIEVAVGPPVEPLPARMPYVPSGAWVAGNGHLLRYYTR